jgi:hypothetical protein
MAHHGRITAWLEVRVLLTEISPNPAISPESAGFLRVGFVSRSPRLELRRLFGPFVSGLKIPFPGNGDLGSKRLGSNGCFSDPEDEHFRSVLEGGNRPVILGPCGRVGIAPRSDASREFDRCRSRSAVRHFRIEQVFERIDVHRIELIRRENTAQNIYKYVSGCMFEPKFGVHLVEKRGCDDAGGRHLGHLLPKIL